MINTTNTELLISNNVMYKLKKKVKTRSGLVALQFEEGYCKNMNYLISMEIIYRIWKKIQSNIKIAFKNSMYNQRKGLIKCF